MNQDIELINEVTAKCSRQQELTELKQGRELTRLESYLFQLGYLYGHAEGQRYARKILENITEIVKNQPR